MVTDWTHLGHRSRYRAWWVTSIGLVRDDSAGRHPDADGLRCRGRNRGMNEMVKQWL